MSWLRQLVAGFVPWRLDPKIVHVGFMVDRVALGWVFLWIFWFSHQHHSTNALYLFICYWCCITLVIDSVIKKHLKKPMLHSFFSTEWVLALWKSKRKFLPQHLSTTLWCTQYTGKWRAVIIIIIIIIFIASIRFTNKTLDTSAYVICNLAAHTGISLISV